MKVIDLIERAMHEARKNTKAIEQIAKAAEYGTQQDNAVTMKIAILDEPSQRMLFEPFYIPALSTDDFAAVLKIMARIAARDAFAAKQALKGLNLDDNVIEAITEDRELKGR